MAERGLLLLVPTGRERDMLAKFLPRGLPLVCCGFGPVAAATETAIRLAKRPDAYSRVILAGIGGSYDPDRFPPGSAASFRRVRCEGPGAGEGSTSSTSREMGIPQLELPDGQPIHDELDLQPLPHGPVFESLLTVMSASDSASMANRRRQKFPECLCEDMEAFGVALAAVRLGMPVTVVRGASNLAGDRNHAGWQIETALRSVAERIQSVTEANG
jgi:futalosine hydrolase